MYKITKDLVNQGMFYVSYFLVDNMNTPLYSIENCNWSQVMEFVKHTQIDSNDSTWMYDVIRLTDRRVLLNDLGNWSVL